VAGWSERVAFLLAAFEFRDSVLSSINAVLTFVYWAPEAAFFVVLPEMPFARAGSFSTRV